MPLVGFWKLWHTQSRQNKTGDAHISCLQVSHSSPFDCVSFSVSSAVILSAVWKNALCRLSRASRQACQAHLYSTHLIKFQDPSKFSLGFLCICFVMQQIFCFCSWVSHVDMHWGKYTKCQVHVPVDKKPLAHETDRCQSCLTWDGFAYIRWQHWCLSSKHHPGVLFFPCLAPFVRKELTLKLPAHVRATCTLTTPCRTVSKVSRKCICAFVSAFGPFSLPTPWSRCCWHSWKTYVGHQIVMSGCCLWMIVLLLVYFRLSVVLLTLAWRKFWSGSDGKKITVSHA